MQNAGAARVPELGLAIRHEWPLDWDWLTVNHGSFGATPTGVLAAQDQWRQQMEAQPSRFMRLVLPDALREAATQLAQFLGAQGPDVVFVENATVGCNAVLRSLRLQPGDEGLVLTHGYGAVRNTVRYLTERAGARMTEANVPFPRPEPDQILASLDSAITSRTRIAVLDHITSGSALVLPVEAMVALCHRHGVPVLIDGAHGPGQVTLDLSAIDADWYVGNCHKWLCAPKGAAFLWAAPDRQQDLHPVTISHGLGHGYLEEFDWTGTRDFSPFLAVPDAIEFHERLGGVALRERNHALALQATALVSRRLNTEQGADSSLMGAMGMVRLPLTGEASTARAQEWRGRMLEAKTDVPLHAHSDGIWLRLSAHAYNTIEDYERLAEIVAAVLRNHD